MCERWNEFQAGLKPKAPEEIEISSFGGVRRFLRRTSGPPPLSSFCHIRGGGESQLYSEVPKKVQLRSKKSKL
jgi:hypothetical protein